MHESYIRYSAEEKETIVLSVKRSELSIVQALKRLGIPRRTFYNWYQKYATGGVNALRETPYRRQTTWNRIPDNYSSFWYCYTTIFTCFIRPCTLSNKSAQLGPQLSLGF